jgi:Ni/Co efflux regulator RcnB
MKRFLLASSISLMLLSSAAMAAPGHGHGGGGGQGHGPGNAHANQSGGHGDRWVGRDDGNGNRRHYRHGNRYAYGHRAHHDNGLHLGQHKFERGERVPSMYMERRYYVEDYNAYNLAPPPTGYRWVRPDTGRYLLISTATGLISQMLGY